MVGTGRFELPLARLRLASVADLIGAFAVRMPIGVLGVGSP